MIHVKHLYADKYSDKDKMRAVLEIEKFLSGI